MENIVYNELLIRGYNVDTGIVDMYGKIKKENAYTGSLRLIL